MPQPISPSDQYRQRLQARELYIKRLESIHIRLGYLRLLLVASLIGLIWIYLRSHTLLAIWLSVPVVLFVAVAVFHAKVLDLQAIAERGAEFYRQGLARIEDKWRGTGARGERFDVSDHLYAADLDLFGHGSLFQLISLARTRMGEDTLANWLLRPSTVEIIRLRHQAIADLRDRLDFREAMAISSQSPVAAVHPDPLLSWAQAPLQLPSRPMRWIAFLLSILMVAAATYWISTGLRTPFFLVLLLEGIVVLTHRARVSAVLHQTEHALADLKLISSLLARIEAEEFESAPLRDLKERLSTHHVAASKAIARLDTIGQYIQSLENPLMRLIDIPFLYSVQVAFAADSWRRQFGATVPVWLAELGEMEALLSLAGYSFERHEDPFPTFVSGPSCFHAQSLGHPLLPASRCVRNDLSLDASQRVVLVSGSNMSGKSTLMRAVGINIVLAMAGAPVRAQALELTPLHVGASILVNDSLQKGASRFYAEITRLRHILDLATEEPPLLFLLDELLQGTNSRDRLVGADGVLRALLETNAIGLISTHDLALTALRSDQLHNMHFQDQIEDGKMKFDYILYPGPVTRSNGVELMRLIGLDV
ncbi:MAG TPA: mismatch repair protein [Edaphobacter sp.]|nr:mismatch repair protein [Edaphobacter sp.]